MRSSRGIFILLIVVVALFVVPPAHAQCADCQVQNPEDGFSGWEDLEPMGYNPPVYNYCSAYASANQRCRECAGAYYDNGGFKGYYVCAYVSLSSSCRCQNANTLACRGEGACSYHP